MSNSNIITLSKNLQIITQFLLICLLISPFSNPQAQKIMLPTNPKFSNYNGHLSSSCSDTDPTRNTRPVIGIISHPGDGASGRLKNGTNVSYIAASYVKFVESAGSLVIPLVYTEPWDVLLEKLDLVNGVLFTGGWAKQGLYFDVVGDIFKKVLEKNDAGQYFPCYAICLGFELIIMIVSKDHNILESYNSTYESSSLQFVEDVSIQGNLFQRFPPDLLRKLSTDCLVLQNHRFGISPEKLQDNQRLSSFFKILTTSIDRNNKVYVSTAQAQHYPVTGFQWHPEKNAFEGGNKMIPHSEDAIHVTQWTANYFYQRLFSGDPSLLEKLMKLERSWLGESDWPSEARKSPNRPPTKDVLDNVIYNYSPTYCGKAGKGYDEVYIFA